LVSRPLVNFAIGLFCPTDFRPQSKPPPEGKAEGGAVLIRKIAWVAYLTVMPRSPSIVPEDADRDVYIVLDDFGRLGRAWRETDADRGTLMRHLLEGQF
jgi:hypothetical protein